MESEVNMLKKQEEIKQIFSQRLKEIRTAKGLTQPKLAKLIQSTDRNISNYETGYSLPSVPVLLNLSIALSTSVDYLLGLSNNPSITHSDNHLTSKDYQLIEQLKSDKEIYDYLTRDTESGVSYIYDSWKLMRKWRHIGHD